MPDPIARSNNFGNDVIVVDGMWGAGKSAISGVIGSMDRVEKKRINSIFEYTCVGYHLGLVDRQYADTLISTFVDSLHYDTMIGREVNLRWSDDSGVRDTLRRGRYLRRLFSRGGDSIVDRIRSENIAAQFVTHELLGVAEILFTTLQDRLRFVWVTRHPVHLLPYFAAYLERYDHVREFTLSVENDGSRIPWFGRQFASDWIRLSAGERAVLCIDYLIRLSWSFLDQHSAVTNRVLVVEFETFVCDPTPTMHQLQELLGRQLHPHSARLLRRANIPRPSPSADGRTFSSLAQSAASSDARSERLRYREILKAHLKSGARENRKLFETLVRDYDRRHPTVLAAYADEFTEIHTR